MARPASGACMTGTVKVARVALDLSIQKLLDYIIPEALAEKISPGSSVIVPLRNAKRKGFVFDIREAPSLPYLKAIDAISSENPLITPDLFELALWMEKYYATDLQTLFKALLPSSIKKGGEEQTQLFVMRKRSRKDLADLAASLRAKKPAQAKVLDVMLKVEKGIFLSDLLSQTEGSKSPVDTLCKEGALSLIEKVVDKSPLANAEFFPSKPKKLTPEQKEAFEKIETTLDKKVFGGHLLFGVTGSGKTEVYLQAIQKTLDQGRGVIMLVPEIALTPQTLERFLKRFGKKISVLHYRLSHGERVDQWNKILRGETPIVIGARSAVFSPVPNLGLILVDEEHESSYKQSEMMPCYHAREVALVRGRILNACVVLGSATPSFESYQNAIQGKFSLLKLTERADHAQLPHIRLVDMKPEWEKGNTLLSSFLLEGIQDRLNKGEQTILLLNRRGYHTSLNCKLCGEALHCSQCSTTLTYHLSSKTARCHLCGFFQEAPFTCPTCKTGQAIEFKGTGTEKVEKVLYKLFPSARTLRMDRDTTSKKGGHEAILRAFGSGKGDILIGTQMIAKGHHFPQVTLVGVLSSDASLQLPDFRSTEYTFQLLTQVAGRAGRGEVKGEVILQTLNPDHPLFSLASKGNYEKFFTEEIDSRKLFNFPPHQGLVKLVLSGKDERKTLLFGEKLRQELMKNLSGDNTIHPLLPCGYSKIKNYFRYQMLLQGPSIYALNQAWKATLEKQMLPREIKLLWDVNPTGVFS